MVERNDATEKKARKQKAPGARVDGQTAARGAAAHKNAITSEQLADVLFARFPDIEDGKAFRRALAVFDVDGDGTIDFDEFARDGAETTQDDRDSSTRVERRPSEVASSSFEQLRCWRSCAWPKGTIPRSN